MGLIAQKSLFMGKGTLIPSQSTALGHHSCLVQGLRELDTSPWNLSASKKQTGGDQHLLRPSFESFCLCISGSGTQLPLVHKAD